jgi:cyanophycin synthetase
MEDSRPQPRIATMSQAKNDIQLLRITYLRGPNIWTYRPVLETWLDLGELEDYPSNQLPGFTDRLCRWLPALQEHQCGVGEPGGFLQRLQEGTWMGHVLEHVVIELLNLAGMPTGFGQTRSTSRRGVYRMVFRSRDEGVGRCALAQGHALLMAAINEQPFDVAAAVEAVRRQIDASFLGPSTASIVAAATDRRIPHLRLTQGNLVQLGFGARQCRIWTAETERTSAIGESIARDKDLTNRLLKSVGVPVPEGRTVSSAEEAWEAAEDIGLPVVVKPIDGNHGRGVSLDLHSREEVMAAWKVAEPHGSEVLVERCIPGNEHRLLVVGGKLVAAARGESLYALGDGRSTVQELVDTQINTDPRRGNSEEHPLNLVEPREDGAILLDLERQGLTPDSVPAAGRRVLIQRNGNVSIDCTDEVHPEVAHAVCLAARTVGLDIAGVDLVAQDIGRPLAEQGGGIVEVNAGPGLLMHLKPAAGQSRPVGRAIVEHLFPEPAESGREREASADHGGMAHPGAGRIPIVGITGATEVRGVAPLAAWLLRMGGHHVGLASREGLFLDSRRIDSADARAWNAGRRLLMNRSVNAAVFEHSAGHILREGLVYDRCSVGVVTDLGGIEGLEDQDVTHSEQLVKVVRTQIDVVLGQGVGVLHAADPRVAALAELCDGEVLLYAEDGNLPAMVAHRAAGGRTVQVSRGRLVLSRGGEDSVLCHAATLSDACRLPIGPMLAASAVAWAMGLSPDLIVAGLKTFTPSEETSHGR